MATTISKSDVSDLAADIADRIWEKVLEHDNAASVTDEEVRMVNRMTFVIEDVLNAWIEAGEEENAIVRREINSMFDDAEF